MSAQIAGTVRSVERPMPHLGDRLSTHSRPAGQLWERVAEHGRSQEPLGTRSPRFICAVIRAIDRMPGVNPASLEGIEIGRGPNAIYSGLATPKCSGIIRAGVRVK